MMFLFIHFKNEIQVINVTQKLKQVIYQQKWAEKKNEIFSVRVQRRGRLPYFIVIKSV